MGRRTPELSARWADAGGFEVVLACHLDVSPPESEEDFGKYRLLARIAVGGMAEVFRAVRPGLEGFEKIVAIKRIRPHLSREQPFLRMFLHEAKLAAQLQHPNIVQIFDLGRIGESYFIAMEYIPGRDMSRVIPKAERRGIRFPLEYAMGIISNVLDGLAFAHAKTNDFGEPLNIVHRDLTPENIMVGWNGNVKILDFGIAKAATQTDETRAGEIKGKLSYLSPEQCLGKSIDARSDIFTLGTVLYEWITGYKLFTGENEMAVIRAIMDGRIYPPSYFREDLPEGVEGILMRALEKDRERRYQSARDFQFDLQSWLRDHAAFVPAPLHLANFMRQLFEDEIEKEQAVARELRGNARREGTYDRPVTPVTPAESVARVSGREGRLEGRPGAPPPAPVSPRRLSLVESLGPESGLPSTGGSPPTSVLQVHLSDEEGSRLAAKAARHGISPEALVEDLLRVTLKYF